MPHQFSDWFSSETQPTAVLSTPLPKLPGGVNNRFYKRAYAILDLSPLFAVATPDVCRMMRLRHTDRISKLCISSSGASTVTTVNVGLYLPGTAADGAVIDADEFASAVAVNGLLDGVDIFAEAAAAITDSIRRGAPLWEVAGYASAGAAVLAGADFMDICLTAAADVTTADEPVVLEAWGSFGI